MIVTASHRFRLPDGVLRRLGPLAIEMRFLVSKPRFKLHHFPMSRSARVKWMLHEVVGDAFEVIKVDLSKGAHRSAQFLELNPNHAVPVLEISWDDGTITHMIESGAIVNFLADAFPEKKLAPPADGSAARVDFLQMLHFASTSIDMMLWQIRVHLVLLSEGDRDPKTVERYRNKFTDEVQPQLAQHLSQNAYICGDNFSAADCVMGHCMAWARSYHLAQDDVFKNYIERLRTRPAFQSAFADTSQFSSLARG